MEAIGTQARNHLFHSTARTLTAIALATAVIAGASIARAADSNDRVTPPNPADVAILRGLLALQHPSLRQGAPAQAVAPTATPAVTTEPAPEAAQGPSAIEGEACLTPDGATASSCEVGPETSGAASVKLVDSFRASLDRAMAAAGYDGERF